MWKVGQGLGVRLLWPYVLFKFSFILYFCWSERGGGGGRREHHIFLHHNCHCVHLIPFFFGWYDLHSSDQQQMKQNMSKKQQQKDNTNNTSNTIAIIAPAGSPSLSRSSGMASPPPPPEEKVVEALQFMPCLFCEHTWTTYSSARRMSMTVYWVVLPSTEIL